MPGLNQLKSFTEDVKDLGDETKIRIQRGEKPVELPLPEGISEEDDSEDFVLGLPETDGNAENTDNSQKDASIDSIVPGVANADNVASAGDGVPDLDSILNPSPQTPDDSDLSEFLDDVPSEPVVEETPLEDLDLDSLLKPTEEPSEEVSEPATEEVSEPTQEDIMPSFDDNADFSALTQDLGDLSDLPDLDDTNLAALNDEPIEEVEAGGENAVESEVQDDTPKTEDLNDDFAFSGEMIDMNEGLPEEISETDDIEEESTPEVPQEEMPSLEDTAQDDFSMPDLDDFGTVPSSEENIDSIDTPQDSFEMPQETDSFEMPQASDDLQATESLEPSTQETDFNVPDFDDLGQDASSTQDDVGAMFDTSALDFGGEGGEVNPSDSVEESQETTETFEAPPNLDDFDFGGSDNAGGEGADGADEFPVTDAREVDDFVLDDNFEIPGFSDTDIAAMDKKKKPKVDTADFSQAVLKPKNTLTDKEYAQFKKNLNEYPLNVRIAVEDLIVKNEFTDEAVFEVVEKVLKKVSARQLATHLEKMLDVVINVPRDFERRSFAQYEAYKASFQYQLRNRIIPGIIAAIVIFMTGWCLFDAVVSFIYKPIKAGNLYSQGYNLLEQNDYEQADIKFRQAVEYKQDLDWYFKYARGYRTHKQFERAAWMYQNIILTKKFQKDGKPNKEAGLEFAQMRAYDEAKFEDAENIVRRNVLDHYLSDPDGILCLGDINLEWGETDKAKYEVAKGHYTQLCQLYPKEDVYWARMLRYYMRTDKLVKVLEFKNRFYPREKSLTGAEWTDLSGYLLEKLYGKLTPLEEEYREKIEDVLGMLKFAVEYDSQNPIASYNMAKYNMYNGNNEASKAQLRKALSLFKKAEKRTRKNTYKEIDASRLLGELYVKSRDFLKAEETYTHGINVFKTENKKSDFEGDENTGKLFADLGDINYFISGDMDGALYNYETAIKTQYDIPQLNYRVGAIKYNNQDYDGALMSFIKTAEQKGDDVNVLLALGNVLSLRGDNHSASTRYKRMLQILNNQKVEKRVLSPKMNVTDYEVVDKFVKVNNNLGVALYKIAKQTGDSKLNGESLVRLQDSLRAWDALTRNEKTMVRLEGSNLAAQNLKYITQSYKTFEPSIYTDIPKIMDGDFELKP